MEERIIFEVDFNLSEAGKQAILFAKKVAGLRKEQDDLKKSYKAGEIGIDDYTAQTLNLQNAIKSATREQKAAVREVELQTKANEANALSYNSISAQLALAQKNLIKLGDTFKLNEDGTLELNEAFKEQFDEVERLKTAQLTFDKAIRNGSTNVGNYERSITDAFKSVNLFGVSIGDAGENLGDVFKNGVNTAKSALDGLYKAVLANPITLIFGLLALAVVAVVTAFTSTEKGANKVSQIFAKFTPIINAVYSALAGVGEVIFNVIDAFATLATYFGGFEKEAKQAEALEKGLQDVARAQIKLDAQNKQAIASQEKLKSLRDDESKSFEERIKANDALGKNIEANYKDQLANAKKELALEEEKLKLKPENLRGAEDLKKVEGARSKLAEISEDFYGRITEQIVNQVSLLKDSLTVQADISDALTEQRILTGKIAEGSAEELTIRKKAVQQRLDIELQQFDKEKKLSKLSRDEKLKFLAKTNTNAELLILQANNSQLELDKDFREAQVEKYTEYLEKQKELRESYLNQQLAGFELQVEKEAQGTVAKIEAEKVLIRESSKAKIENEKLVGNELLLEKQKTSNLILEKDAEIGEMALSQVQARLERATILDEKNVTAQIALLEYNSERKIENEKLVGETLLLETAKTEKAISDLNEQKRVKDAQASLLDIQNIVNTEKAKIDAQRFAIEQTSENELVKQEMLLQFRKDTLLQLQSAEQESALAQFEFDLEFTAKSEGEKEALKIQYAQQSIDIERKYAEDSKAITAELKNADLSRLSSAKDTFANLKGLFAEQSLAYKVFATSEALVSTYLAANKTLAAFSGIPIPGYAFLQAGITIAQGLLTVAKINGVKLAKGGSMEFAEGGAMGIFGGNSHQNGGTKGVFSDGTQIEVEKGELFAVVNKKNTALLSNLSALNSFGGNGTPFFEGGGVLGSQVASIGSDLVTTNMQNESLLNALASMPAPQVEITEIIKAQKRVNVTETISSQ